MTVVVTGGAGFIGSHLVDRLMQAGHTVTVLDNLSGGRKEFLTAHFRSPRFRFVQMDVRDRRALQRILAPAVDIVFHLAANADVARGAADPSVDFEHSLVATFSLLEAMRFHGIRKLVYTSGSGVYGDWGKHALAEHAGPLLPVSMYGATKLGAEGLISAFAHLFDLRAWVVRPANIIGPRVTHGVVFDFVRRLKKTPKRLRILGDGRQSKSYLHVADVIDAMLLVLKKSRKRVNIFNVSSRSFVTVNEIAFLVTRAMQLRKVKVTYTGGKVGWNGDVPVMRLQSARLRALGWRPRYTSRQAVEATVAALLPDPRIRRLHVSSR